MGASSKAKEGHSGRKSERQKRPRNERRKQPRNNPKFQPRNDLNIEKDIEKDINIDTALNKRGRKRTVFSLSIQDRVRLVGERVRSSGCFLKSEASGGCYRPYRSRFHHSPTFLSVFTLLAAISVNGFLIFHEIRFSGWKCSLSCAIMRVSIPYGEI